MGPNFLACDRDQALLLPPSLREWLPDGHLAWFVIDAVEQFDLTAFYRAYRLDGQGRAAHEPSMMVALLLYSYAVGERSSRRIERRCVEDVATGVLKSAMRIPKTSGSHSPCRAVAGPLSRTLGDVHVAAIRQEMHDCVGRPSGTFRLAGRAWFVTGRA